MTDDSNANANKENSNNSQLSPSLTRNTKSAPQRNNNNNNNNNSNDFKPKPPSSAKSQPTRPRSGGRRKNTPGGGNDIESRLANLEKLKNTASGTVGNSGNEKSFLDQRPITRSHNNWTTTSFVDHNSSGADGNGSASSLNNTLKIMTFSCPDCKREHVSQRDLDIHRPFCFNRM